MATLERKRLENIEGNFYVDSSCIDCDTCRWMAAEIFNRQGSQSAVYQQPTTDREATGDASSFILPYCFYWDSN